MGKNVIFRLLSMLYLFIYVVASLDSSTGEYALLAIKSQITYNPNEILAKNWSQGTSFCNDIDFGIAKLFTEDQRISLTRTFGTIGCMAPSKLFIQDVYSYGIMLMETFTTKKPTDDTFVGDFTMRRSMFESFPNAITQMVDVDLVNAVEDNVESCFRSMMGLALECTVDLPEERLDMKDVVTRLKKIKIELC
ncbi:Leucine-rich repeat protein kinase family protein [Abeliophyllum distichum]|uniref:Leucine-rich repeat protein kinase family protein n=1 Tax=Abeliophyllum distichum TaxID=126358 RepID=A0ABD1QUA6_9LAMI